MKLEKMQYAYAEAERFLDAVTRFRRSVGPEKKYRTKANEHLATSKYTSAVRRASMDLTRALAEMRKNDY